MPHDPNQFIQAAAWWAARLPGAGFSRTEIQKRVLSNLPSSVERASKATDAIGGKFQYTADPVSPEKFTEILAKKIEEAIRTGNGLKRSYLDNSEYIELETDYNPMGVLAEAACEAGLQRNPAAFPWKTSVYLQEDGRIIVPGENGMEALEYESAGNPQYKYVRPSQLDFEGCPELSALSLARVVPVEPGQEVITVVGDQEFSKEIAEENQALILAEYAAEGYFDQLTNEDVLNPDKRITFTHLGEAGVYVDGKDSGYGDGVYEATESPNVFAFVENPMPYKVVEEPFSIGCGGNYQIFQVGDVIALKGKGGVKKISKDQISKERVRFIDHNPAGLIARAQTEEVLPPKSDFSPKNH